MVIASTTSVYGFPANTSDLCFNALHVFLLLSSSSSPLLWFKPALRLLLLLGTLEPQVELFLLLHCQESG